MKWGTMGHEQEIVMFRRAGTVWVRRLLVALFLSCVFLLLAAASPEDLVRQGNEALAAGNPEAAGRMYEAAEEHTSDPGLVAFNEGVAFAVRGEFREAEVRFLRALDDRAAPTERRARASYNRGVCLLLRGRNTAAFRTAIECFERCLEANTDAALVTDARHNLELAKVLWGKARLLEKTPPRASDPPPESRPELDPARTDPDPGPGDDADTDRTLGRVSSRPTAGAVPRGQNPLETPQQAPGAGNLPVRLDDAPQPLTPTAAREHLKHVAERLRDDRRKTAELTAGPERPDVPDW